MAKRFTDTGLNRQPWYRRLKPKLKCAIRFLFDECDQTGVWSVDMEALSYFVGEDVSYEELFKGVNADKDNRIEKFGRDKIFIPGFIEFQYGSLSENCKPHKPIFSLLKKHGLYERVLIGYAKGIDTLQEKEKDKEEEIEKETEKDFGKSENLSMISQMWDLWKKSFPKYEANKRRDYPPLGEVLTFMCEQAGKNFDSDSDQITILNTFQLIADQVNREPFWVNKPLRAIAPNVQEFYNKIKNPSNGTSSKQAGKNGSKTSLSKLQEIHSKRYGNGQ